MPADQSLSGRIALVTGASRGIGAAVAKAYARAGAHVVLALHEDEVRARLVGARRAAQVGLQLRVIRDVRGVHPVSHALEVEIEHLEDLLKFEKKEERKGRYEAGGGDPLPEDLAARFREKIIDLKNMHTMMTEAVRRASAQTASGSAEREPT